MGPRLTAEARLLLQRQRWVIASWQGPAVGLDIRALSRAADGHGWQLLTPRTYLASEADPSVDQLRMAGALEGGPEAALSGCCALIEHGWTGDDGGLVDLLLPRGSRSRSRRLPNWIRLRETTEVPRRVGQPRRAHAARAAVDAAAWARTPRERMFILTSSLQQRLATVDQVRREVDSRSRVRWSRELREVLEEVEFGVSSMHEATFRRLCRERGLPVPRMQVRRVAGGRKRVIDAIFTRTHGRTVVVEIDGAAHMEAAQWYADLDRQNDLAAETGAIFLRVTGWQLQHDPEPFFAALALALAR